MITAVDTNVLIDVFAADPTFGQASAKAVRRCLEEGALVACAVVWAETATAFPEQRLFLDAMQTLGVGYSNCGPESALLAAAAWRRYRKKGGSRKRVVADFLIGSHAQTHCDRLLTRDRGFYRDYFGKLKIIDPTR